MFPGVGDYKGPQAQARRTRTSIYIGPVPDMNTPGYANDITGGYYGNQQPDYAKINYPESANLSDPQWGGELSDVLKHELIHQSLAGAILPKDYELERFHSVSSPIPIDPNNIKLEAMPMNAYNWSDWERAGKPSEEIPAYMSIFRPEQMGVYPGRGRVTQDQRNQYMQDFYDYLSEVPGRTQEVPGLIKAGNIDLHNRPIVRNRDGSVSTVRSVSFNVNGKEVLIPTVADDGSRILSNQEALEQYRRTGKHLGIFDTPQNATAYSQRLHKSQEFEYAPRGRMQNIKSIIKGREAYPNIFPGYGGYKVSVK